MSNKLADYINNGYEKLQQNESEQALALWQKGYSELKKQLKNDKISLLQLGNQFGHQLRLGNWLKQIANVYLKNEQYNETISYCQDISKTFKEDKYLNDFQIMTGKALFYKNDLDQANEHFKTLLRLYPNDLNIIYAYLHCLKTYDISQCKAIITRYVPLTLEYNIESETLFQLCKDILTELDETQLAKEYNSVKKVQNDFGKRKPVSKKVKVGRNDPCPCGSGKKYKNCCGR